MKKILIIEDEKKLADIMKLYLERENYEVCEAFDGEEALDLMQDKTYDLIILDVMMPKIDGWSLLRKIKKIHKNTPVIMTTARGEEEDRIFGLELGADDYMVKPLSMKELILRVKLRMRHYNASEEEDKISIGNLHIDKKKREVIENKNIISLTPKEFDLLIFLIENANIVFKRDNLLNKVWEYDFEGDTRTVDTHVKNLREKLGFCRENLKTIWGVGYKFEIEKEDNYEKD